MNQKQQHSFSNFFGQSVRLLASISILTAGISLGLADKALSQSLVTKEDTFTIATIISRTEFLANYPIGTVMCFNDNQVRIVEFNQSFQMVDFIYLSGGYQGLKDSADYSKFIYNSHSCS